jgi:hypothetical protein
MESYSSAIAGASNADTDLDLESEVSESAMTDEELISLLDQEIEDAREYTENFIGYERAENLDYYFRRNFGNEQDGRSQVVSSDVADTVDWLVPSLLKIFASTDKVVEFSARTAKDVQGAEQSTLACNYVFYTQNDGFLRLYEWIQDGLLQKAGVFKYWWDTSYVVTEESYRGLTEQDYQYLTEDETVEIIEQSMTQEMVQAPPMPGQPPQMVPVIRYDCKIKRAKPNSRIKIETVPPEELKISSRSRSANIQDSPFIAHETPKTKEQLISEGYDEEVVERLPVGDSANRNTQEALARRQNSILMADEDITERTVWVQECYYRVDQDGDGIAELRKICKVGKELLSNEIIPEIPFASWCPKIISHEYFGNCPADDVKDLQELKSAIWRQTMDSLYQANVPRWSVVEGQVDLDDLLSARPGGAVRMTQPGAATPLLMPFVGQQTFPMIEYIDTVRENRTGVTRYSQGLDSDSLNKMLDIFTSIPMADGSKKLLKDVVAGDVLIGSDGKAVTVSKAHPIADPERAYRLRFLSGEEIIAGGEHLWTVQTQWDKSTGRSRVLNTDAIYERKLDFDENIYIPRIQRPMFGDDVGLPIDPYILGYWLGNGHAWSPRFTTMDQEIVNRFAEWAKSNNCEILVDRHQNAGKAITYYVKGGLYKSLRDLDLIRRNDSDDYDVIGKHIPKIYLQSSYAQRLELLRGLMDSDVCHHSGALVVFSQKAGRLANDVIRLVEGLGGWPGVSDVDPGDCGKEGVEYFNIAFHIFDNPFWLERKAVKWSPPKRNINTQPIVLIEPVSIRPMRCLTVDAADGLFCIGYRFTVTHNTATGINIITNMSQQKVELYARIAAEVGLKNLFRGILRLLAEHQQEAMMVRLNDGYVSIDPSAWQNEYDMTINVGLGTGNKDQQLMHLSQIAMSQAQIAMSPFGQMLISPKEIYNTQAKIAQNAGFKDPGQFWKDPGTQMPPPPPPPPQLIKEKADHDLAVKKEENRHAEEMIKLRIEAAKLGMPIEVMTELGMPDPIGLGMPMNGPPMNGAPMNGQMQPPVQPPMPGPPMESSQGLM